MPTPPSIDIEEPAMTRSQGKKRSLPLAGKLHHCCKVNCHRPLPLNHPTSFTNGLCERHFFSIDLPTDDNDDDNADNCLTNEPNAKQRQQAAHDAELLRGDTRLTREVFDGRQWRVFEEVIDRQTTSTDRIASHPDHSSAAMNKDNLDMLAQIDRLLANYRTVLEELKLPNDH